MQLAGNPFKPPERSSSPRLLAPIGAGAEQHQNQPAKGAKQSHSPWTASKPKKKHRQLHSDEDDTDTPLRVAASLQPQHWADENVPPLPGGGAEAMSLDVSMLQQGMERLRVFRRAAGVKGSLAARRQQQQQQLAQAQAQATGSAASAFFPAACATAPPHGVCWGVAPPVHGAEAAAAAMPPPPPPAPHPHHAHGAQQQPPLLLVPPISTAQRFGGPTPPTGPQGAGTAAAGTTPCFTPVAQQEAGAAPRQCMQQPFGVPAALGASCELPRDVSLCARPLDLTALSADCILMGPPTARPSGPQPPQQPALGQQQQQQPANVYGEAPRSLGDGMGEVARSENSFDGAPHMAVAGWGQHQRTDSGVEDGAVGRQATQEQMEHVCRAGEEQEEEEEFRIKCRHMRRTTETSDGGAGPGVPLDAPPPPDAALADVPHPQHHYHRPAAAVQAQQQQQRPSARAATTGAAHLHRGKEQQQLQAYPHACAISSLQVPPGWELPPPSTGGPPPRAALHFTPVATHGRTTAAAPLSHAPPSRAPPSAATPRAALSFTPGSSARKPTRHQNPHLYPNLHHHHAQPGQQQGVGTPGAAAAVGACTPRVLLRGFSVTPSTTGNCYSGFKQQHPHGGGSGGMVVRHCGRVGALHDGGAGGSPKGGRRARGRAATPAGALLGRGDAAFLTEEELEEEEEEEGQGGMEASMACGELLEEEEQLEEDMAVEGGKRREGGGGGAVARAGATLLRAVAKALGRFGSGGEGCNGGSAVGGSPRAALSSLFSPPSANVKGGGTAAAAGAEFDDGARQQQLRHSVAAAASPFAAAAATAGEAMVTGSGGRSAFFPRPSPSTTERLLCAAPPSQQQQGQGKAQQQQQPRQPHHAPPRSRPGATAAGAAADDGEVSRRLHTLLTRRSDPRNSASRGAAPPAPDDRDAPRAAGHRATTFGLGMEEELDPEVARRREEEALANLMCDECDFCTPPHSPSRLAHGLPAWNTKELMHGGGGGGGAAEHLGSGLRRTHSADEAMMLLSQGPAAAAGAHQGSAARGGPRCDAGSGAAAAETSAAPVPVPHGGAHHHHYHHHGGGGGGGHGWAQLQGASSVDTGMELAFCAMMEQLQQHQHAAAAGGGAAEAAGGSSRQEGQAADKGGRGACSLSEWVGREAGGGGCSSGSGGGAEEDEGLGARALVHAGLLETVDEFNAHLSMAAERGDRVRAERLWGEMQSRALQPDMRTLNMLMRCLCKSVIHPDEAETLMCEVCTLGALQPNATTLTLLAEMRLRYEQLHHHHAPAAAHHGQHHAPAAAHHGHRHAHR